MLVNHKSWWYSMAWQQNNCVQDKTSCEVKMAQINMLIQEMAQNGTIHMLTQHARKEFIHIIPNDHAE